MQNPSNLASVHLGLNMFTLSRTGSPSHTRTPNPANHLSCVVNHPRHQTRASAAPLKHILLKTAFVVLTRPPTVKMALPAMPLPSESPGGFCSVRTQLLNTTDEFTDAWLSVCSDSCFLAPQSIDPFRKQTCSVWVTTSLHRNRSTELHASASVFRDKQGC